LRTETGSVLDIKYTVICHAIYVMCCLLVFWN